MYMPSAVVWSTEHCAVTRVMSVHYRESRHETERLDRDRDHSMAMGPQQQYRLLHLHTASAGESLSLKNLVHRRRPAPVHMGDGESPLVALARSIAARATILTAQDKRVS